MAHVLVARRCLSVLDGISDACSTATAFKAEVNTLSTPIAELRPLFTELLSRRQLPEGVQRCSVALEGIEAALRNFQEAAERCGCQGPLETLLKAEQLLKQLVDSCLRLGKELEPLQQPTLPTVVVAQAKLLGTQLETSTLSFSTLRRLHCTLSELQEEAELARLDNSDGGAFTALLTRLTVRCPPVQLASDAAFLARRAQEAVAGQHHCEAYFFQLAASILQALMPPLPATHVPKRPKDRTVAAAAGQQSAGGETTGTGGALERQQAGEAATQAGTARTSASVPGGWAESVAQLSSPSASQHERVAAIDILCHALQRQERGAAATLVEGGVGVLLRLMVSSSRTVRLAALRLLVALLEAEPACIPQLVAARGAPVLVHLLATCLEAGTLQGTPTVAALRCGGGMEWQADVASVSISVLAVAPAGKGLGTSERKPAERASPRPAARAVAVDLDQGPGKPGTWASDEELCLHAVALLRQLCSAHMAQLVVTGAIRALCRCSTLPRGSRLASAAVAALTDAAQDGLAAVQMLQERLLVTLADMARSPRPSEAALAFACFSALMEHPCRMSDGATNQQQLCADMGRACDIASVTVLMDALAGETGSGVRSAGSDWRMVVPGVVQLLPTCLHSPETRTVALRHGAALRCLLRPVAEADVAAAAVLKRLGSSDDQSKTAVARLLAQALADKSMCGGDRHAGRELALCLADVLRPSGGRDRSALRWAAEACSEAEACGVVRPVMELGSSTDTMCRAAGVACLHALAVYGSQTTRSAMGAAGGVVALVDAVKLEGLPMPDHRLQLPVCVPHSLGQAAAEALAALATTSDKLRRDVCMQLCAFLGSSSSALAASACHALSVLLAEVPAVSPILAELGVMAPLVAHLSRSPAAAALRRDYGANNASGSAHAAASSGSSSTGNGSGGGTEQEVLELLQQRVVRLFWALCRGGGDAVDAAVGAGAAGALVQRMSCVVDAPLRLEAAAALGPLLKKSAAARDVVGSRGGLGLLLELAGTVPAGLPLWEEALAALASLAAMHAPSRPEASRALRQMLVRGSTRAEVVAAAVVVARMTTGPAGREAVLAEDVVEPLVRLLAVGDDRTRAAAANALCHLAVPNTVQLPPCTALPSGGAVKPRFTLLRAGAVPALLVLLRQAGEPTAPGAPGPGATGAASTMLLPVAEALESLATSDEGVQAIRAAGGVEVLKEVVARGKRRAVAPEVAKAASNTLLQCV